MNSSYKIVASIWLGLTIHTAVLAQDGADPGRPKVESPKIEGDKVAGLKFENINVQDLLRIYEKMTSRPVVFDSSVQGNLTVDTDIVLNKKQAIQLIEQALLLNGFALVIREKETLVLGPGKPTRSAAIPIYYDEKSIPESVSIISYVFELKHANPTELSNVFNQYLATGQPYTSFLPLPGSRCLLVTESTPTIRNLLGLVKRLDVPQPEAVKVLPEPAGQGK